MACSGLVSGPIEMAGMFKENFIQAYHQYNMQAAINSFVNELDRMLFTEKMYAKVQKLSYRD